ncbi:DnaJ domain-containing protein [Desulfofustis glycolicus]|nr:DnaJ domain-containing protein [Desulfofustis glycolicus]MCB2217012.1 DnaJ domain-containing protein [Desulfobulbaceae bacterium]
MKDYYQILGVTEASTEDEIRRRYRKLAMQYHPDRNPDDPQAEEKFKEIAEAYGVLTDPAKRASYNRARATGGPWRQDGATNGFGYSQEDILRDLFRDPRFQQVFQGLMREFQRSGFRSGPQFIRKSFFGGRGGLFFGGLFFLGSLVGPALLRSVGQRLPEKGSLFRSLGNTVGKVLAGVKNRQGQSENQSEASTTDIIYVTPLSTEELRSGKTIQVQTDGPDGREMLKVSIPPDSRAGQRLRLRGKGRPGPAGRGDLYLHLELRNH